VDRERERAEALTASFAIEKAELQHQVTELTEKIRLLEIAKHGSETTSTSVATSEDPSGTTGKILIETTSGETSEPDGVSITGTVSGGGETAGSESSTTTEPESTALVATMAKLLKAQTEAIAAQTQAAAAQHIPTLKVFTGDDMQDEEKTFDRWLELFEERAKLARWGLAQHLHQLKLLLDRSALKAFRTFLTEGREDYDRAMAAL